MPSGKNAMPTPIRPLLEGLPLFADDPILSITPITHQGYCNLSYKVMTQTTVYLIRILKQEGIDRIKEYTLQKRAADAGIAPKVILFDKERGMMVSPFVEGIHHTCLDEEKLQNLATALRRLHKTLVWEEAPLDLEKTIRSRTPSVTKAFDTIRHYPTELAVCHNDPNPQNILWQKDTPILIDFEFAGMNDCYFDLAAVCVEFRLDERMKRDFLDLYFEGSYSLEKVKAYEVLYRQLCKEWFSQR